MLLFVLAAPAEAAAAAEPRDLKIEAAYLYHFLDYITFPGFSSPAQKKHVRLCIYSREALLPYLDYVRRHANGRELDIVPLKSVTQKVDCDMLYVGPEGNNLEALLHRQGQEGMLVVGLRDGFLDAGGMIELEHRGEGISMAINRTRLEEQAFTVSSRLLALAHKVK